MLTNAMRKYVTSQNKNGYSKQVQSVYNSRIKTYAKQALKDLTRLAESLPEDQQTEIFNDKTLGELLKAILKLSPEQMDHIVADKNYAKKKSQRLLPICSNLIHLINDSNLAYLLSPVGSRYMIKEGGQLAFLKAIHYRSWSRDDSDY